MATISAAIENRQDIDLNLDANRLRKARAFALKFAVESAFFLTWFWSWEAGSYLLTKYDLWPWDHGGSAHMPLQVGSNYDRHNPVAVGKSTT